MSRTADLRRAVNWANIVSMTSPRCVGELEEIVDGADHRPLRSNLVEAAEEELPEAPGMFNLAEHGFDDLLSQTISAAPGALRPQSASFRFQRSANVQGWQARGGIRPSLQQHGTRYEIAVGGKPLTYRDLRAIAIATAEDIKTRNPKLEVTVCDLHDDELIVIQNPLPK